MPCLLRPELEVHRCRNTTDSPGHPSSSSTSQGRRYGARAPAQRIRRQRLAYARPVRRFDDRRGSPSRARRVRAPDPCGDARERHARRCPGGPRPAARTAAMGGDPGHHVQLLLDRRLAGVRLQDFRAGLLADRRGPSARRLPVPWLARRPMSPGATWCGNCGWAYLTIRSYYWAIRSMGPPWSGRPPSAGVAGRVVVRATSGGCWNAAIDAGVPFDRVGPETPLRPDGMSERPGSNPRDQNAPVPLGVPRPVGPSQPVRALHHWVVLQLPLLPEVTSYSEEAWL